MVKYSVYTIKNNTAKKKKTHIQLAEVVSRKTRAKLMT